MPQIANTDPCVAVIIASYNAQDTIATAVKSALIQPETLEVFVVDDCSSDQTLEVAKAAGDGDGRLTVLKQAFNQGPSAARNVALSRIKAPFVAVLDSDDAFLPGRFANILKEEDWDLCADNIHFSMDHSEILNLETQLLGAPRSCTIDFETFVLGNLGRRNDNRTELGFLKPVIRRDFLMEHGLAFNDRCRLGEDFVLYTQMLALGARFKLVEKCGYNALVRENSLSAQHSVSHLRAFRDATMAIRAGSQLSPAELHAISRHIRHLDEKIIHREALENRKYRGFFAALWFLLRRPTGIRDILRDRFGRPGDGILASRSLLTAEDFDRLVR